MRPRRRSARLALLVLVCAVVVGGLIAGVLITRDGRGTTSGVQTTGVAPSTGVWAPITVVRPKVPIIAGGIPIDVDPTTSHIDFSTTLFPLGKNRYRMTVFNVSTLGTVNSFQWFPPTGVNVVNLVSSTRGRCSLTGLGGFGGNQFPTIVLYPNIFCDQVDLKPATCTCRGDGESVTITFVTNKGIAVNEGELRLRTATLAFDKVPTYLPAPSAGVRHIKRVVTAAGSRGGLSAEERDDAQRALDSLQDSNISVQLATITTRWVQSVPTACRVAVESQSPRTFEVYHLWVPWLAAEPYIWLTMKITGDPATSTFHLGTSQPVLPGGRLQANGRTVNRLSVDTTLLSRYGPEQVRKGHEILVAHAGDVFAKPGAACEVQKNGSLRLLPS
jgi:hypothetical protein